jgi:2,3-bisphosphoglycerate-dependent phosphoglycerate mutase
MPRLIFIRHGESNATVQRIIGGPDSCSGLSDLGRTQATALAARLARTGEVRATRLIASTYPRAVETAEIIAPALGGLTVEQIYELGEHFPGPLCDGLTFAEFVERYGNPEWNGNPYDVTFPGGESLGAFHHRVAGALHAIVTASPNDTIVVVCHGGVINVVVRELLRAPVTRGFELYTLNTSLTEFVDAEPRTWRMLRYNDSAHLEGLPRETNRELVAEPADLAEVVLREVTAVNVAEIRKVSVWPSQRQFVASVSESLIEAHHTPLRAWYRGAYAGDRPVGFIMMAEPPLSPEIPYDDGWYLWRLLISGSSQRKGYGRRMVELAQAHIASRPETPQGQMYVSWVPSHDGPEGFYRQLGFEPTGDMVAGEVVGRLRFPTP